MARKRKKPRVGRKKGNDDADLGIQIQIKPWLYDKEPPQLKKYQEKLRLKEEELKHPHLPRPLTRAERKLAEHKAYMKYKRRREARAARHFDWGACMYEICCMGRKKPADAYYVYRKWPTAEDNRRQDELDIAAGKMKPEDDKKKEEEEANRKKQEEEEAQKKLDEARGGEEAAPVCICKGVISATSCSCSDPSMDTVDTGIRKSIQGDGKRIITCVCNAEMVGESPWPSTIVGVAIPQEEHAVARPQEVQSYASICSCPENASLEGGDYVGWCNPPQNVIVNACSCSLNSDGQDSSYSLSGDEHQEYLQRNSKLRSYALSGDEGEEYSERKSKLRSYALSGDEGEEYSERKSKLRSYALSGDEGEEYSERNSKPRSYALSRNEGQKRNSKLRSHPSWAGEQSEDPFSSRGAHNPYENKSRESFGETNARSRQSSMRRTLGEPAEARELYTKRSRFKSGSTDSLCSCSPSSGEEARKSNLFPSSRDTFVEKTVSRKSDRMVNDRSVQSSTYSPTSEDKKISYSHLRSNKLVSEESVVDSSCSCPSSSGHERGNSNTVGKSLEIDSERRGKQSSRLKHEPSVQRSTTATPEEQLKRGSSLRSSKMASKERISDSSCSCPSSGDKTENTYNDKKENIKFSKRKTGSSRWSSIISTLPENLKFRKSNVKRSQLESDVLKSSDTSCSCPSSDKQTKNKIPSPDKRVSRKPTKRKSD